ncbi:MAG: hypothetical protein PGN16_04170 [Sphingomonas phyllosphaerae]|uniref:hypothetical protein n=1 Tax=Sphingomonas phyllosphaerae TaxID=257003 RepID=UPI002FFAF540
MAEVVDSIVAVLEARLGDYAKNFNEAADAHERFTRTRPDKFGQFSPQQVEQYANRHKKAAGDVAQAEEQTTARVTRTRKARSDAEVAQSKREADAAKAAAKAKADAEKAASREIAEALKQRQRAEAAAERDRQRQQARFYAAGPRIFEAKAREFSAADRARDIQASRESAAAVRAAEREKQEALRVSEREQAKAAAEAARRAEIERAASAAIVAATERETAAKARLAAVAERASARAGVPAASNSTLGRTVAREATGQRSIPAAALAGDAATEVATAKEINHLAAEQAELQGRLTFARGRDRDVIRERLAELRLTRQLEKAGLDDAAIALRLDERRVLVTRQRAIQERGQASKSVGQFARGAGLSAAAGGGAALAGIATAVGVGVGVEVISSAVEYGKALSNLSKQLGITTTDLQAYLKIARDTGVEQATLSSAFGQFASNLGRAQQGSDEQAKVFKALGVEIKGFKSAGDALPTVIDRISQLKDPLQRAAIETRLFGEEGRKLDALLSGGPEKVSALAKSLQETGRALSQKEIQELDETARKLADVKAQLQVDFARVVAGNADAVITLARAFEAAAASAANFFSRISRQGDLDILNNPTVVRAATLVTGRDPKQVQQEAFNRQLQSREGRQALFDRNQQQLRAIAGTASINAATGKDSVEDERKRLRAEQQTIVRAEAAAKRQARVDVTPPVRAGAVNPGLIRNLDTPKGPKGKSADQIEREAEQRTRQFNDQIAQATDEFLRAQQQLTGSIDARAAIELQLLDNATKARLADIESQRKRNVLAGADAKLEQARADELSAAERKAAAANREVIEQERTLDANRARAAIAATLLDADQTILSAQLGMARTIAERRDIELKLLENAKTQERDRLNATIASAKPGSPEADQARAQLGTLDRRYDAQRSDVEFRNRGVLDQYRDSLPRTADQMNEALENVKVRGLQSLDDAITDSIGKVFQLGGAFGDVANGIISDLIRIGVQRAIIGPLADSLFGAAGGGSAGAVGGFLGKIFGGRASGGNVVGGVPYMVGENGPERVVFPTSGKVYPNGALPTIAGAGQHTTIIAPQHFDLTGVVMTEQLVGQMEQRNRAYANQVAARAGSAAVQAAPGRLQQIQTLGS